MGIRAPLLGTLGAVGVVVLVLLGLGNAVVALDIVPRALDELVLDADAAPPEYAVVPAQSGDLDAELTAAIGVSDTLVEAADAGYIRTWQDAETGAVLRLLALRTNTERGAARSGEELGSALADGGYEEFDVPDIDGARGASLVVSDGDQETGAAAVYFERDRYLFLLAGGATSVGGSGTTPEQVRDQVHGLAVLQAELVTDAGLSRPAEDRGLAESVGTLLGALAGYLLIVGTIGYLRDPLRRTRARSTEAATPAAIDVAEEAQRQRLRAAGLLAGELLAISLALGSALPGVAASTRLALLAVAVALGLAVFLLRRSARPSVASARWTSPGSAVLGLVAVGVVLLGAGMLLLAAATPGRAGFSGSAVCFLAAGGIIHRFAQRLGRRGAHDLLARDQRPPVLFLRSFGDDRLRLRTAALGRPSLLGRLSPNRFDSFEEVLTRHLGRYGPVVAINPPGTRLAPLGAARATIPHDQWQAQVHAWMDAARLVVIGSPPSEPTPGLLLGARAGLGARPLGPAWSWCARRSHRQGCASGGRGSPRPLRTARRSRRTPCGSPTSPAGYWPWWPAGASGWPRRASAATSGATQPPSGRWWRRRRARHHG